MENLTEYLHIANISENCTQLDHIHCLHGNDIIRMKYVYSVIQKFNVIGLVIGITAVVFNSVFLYTMLKVKKKDKPHYRFMKSLSISGELRKGP